MEKVIILFTLGILLSLTCTSALVVNADYITIYPGEKGKVNIEIENNENFDIEKISVQILLGTVLPDNTIVSLPFSIVGSSEKSIDDIRENKDESVSFTLNPSTNIKPGDYNIPYLVKYFEENEDEEIEKQGSFGLRVSAKTELDYSIEIRDTAIVGQEGKISLEIINKGLGEIKSISVEIVPEGFELLSKDKIFIGTINSEDTDLATFDVIYKSEKPVLNARISYKDFENNDQVENISLVLKAYTVEKALELGLIQRSTTWIYIVIVIILIAAGIVYRKLRKRKKKK